MKRMDAPVKLCAILLLLACLWWMLDAPLTREDFQGVGQHFWQARILLPQRIEKMLRHWTAFGLEPQQQEKIGENDASRLVSVYLTHESCLTQMPLEEYVYGVVAAEMPAQYHMEALKAQAVAARTRLLWQIQRGGCALHAGADICTDSGHCQGFATLEECKEKWAGNESIYFNRIKQAQQETTGQWISYNEQPITVLFHAISGGRTENAEMVFASQLPYLISVESNESTDIPGYYQQLTMTYEFVAQKISQALKIPISADDVRRTFSIEGYTDSGRVKKVRIGNTTIQATELRKALGLRSTLFSISMNQEGIAFDQRGYGHGVGMSQAGANSMAAAGADYQQIIQHYYTGVSIVNQ